MEINAETQRIRIGQLEVSAALDALQTTLDLTDLQMLQAVSLWASTVLALRVRSELRERSDA